QVPRRARARARKGALEEAGGSLPERGRVRRSTASVRGRFRRDAHLGRDAGAEQRSRDAEPARRSGARAGGRASAGCDAAHRRGRGVSVRRRRSGHDRHARGRALMVDYRRLLNGARRVAFYGGIGGISLAIGFSLAIVLAVARYEAKLPSVEELKSGYDPPQVTRVLSRDGKLLGSMFTERRTVVPFSEIPKHVKLAFLAAEDASFYEHEGLDYFGMLRALFANVRAGQKRQGASTITQQVVKNLFLTPERTYERKIKETILARRLEKELTKDEIFSLYLNHIYLGQGRYGVEEAARHYFGKPGKALDLAEAALLAGIAAAPERFSPRTHPER